MMLGTLAIAGIPPLAGFFSKDEILYRTFLGNRAIWVLAVVTAAMTAFYMWRLIAMTFYGAYRGPAFEGSHHAADGGQPTSAPHGHPADAADGGGHTHGHGHGAWHGPHESPRAMTVPLMILAAGAVVAGFVGIPGALGGANHIEHFLAPSFEARPVEAVASAADHIRAGAAASAEAHGTAADAAPHAPAVAEHGAVAEGHGQAAAAHEGEAATVGHLSRGAEIGLMIFSVLVAVAGILFAGRNYITNPAASEQMAARFAGAHRVLLNKYYVDELYDATAVKGVMSGSRFLWGFDQRVVDGFVNGSALLTRASAWLSGLLDRTVVDGMVNGTASTMREASHGFRRFQTGLVQNYALLMIVGVFAFVSVYLILR
jgi:NADH-quinone oxidoreductase subunit L